MRVLVVRNTAGVLTPIVDYLELRGTEARIIDRASTDIFGHTSMSKRAILTENMKLTTLYQILRFRPTVIHLNAAFELLPFIRLFAPQTPIVLMYHGRVRLRHESPIETSLADKVIVSTQDLVSFGEWFDRPIPAYFYYRGGREPNTALMIYDDFLGRDYKDQRGLARQVCEELGLRLTIRADRNKIPIHNRHMPFIYSFFEYFLDFKGHDEFVLSKSALEAMCCGCQVLQDSMPYTVLRAEDHLPDDSIYLKYYDMYKGLMPAAINTVIARWLKALVLFLKSMFWGSSN